MRGAAFLKIESSQVEEIFILDSPGLPHCLWRLSHSSPHKESSAIVWLSLKVNDGHSLDPSITIICARLKRQRFLLSLHISWETTFNWAFIVFVSSHFDQWAQHVSFRLYKQCVDFWWAQLHLRLAFSSNNSISLLPQGLLFTKGKSVNTKN